MKKARGTDERLARPRMTGTVIRTFGRAESFKVKSLFGTDERPARPRMTGDGHPYLRKGLKFKVESLFGTDERLARPRMTGDGHPYLWEVSPRMNGTVIRTFPRPLLLVLLGDFSTSC